MSNEEDGTVMTCGCLVLLFNLTIGALCFDYVLDFLFAKNVPWYADVIAGAVCGEITTPLAIIFWIAHLCGVNAPLFK